MMYKWLRLYKIAVKLTRKVNASRTFRSADCLGNSTADSACPRSVNPNSSLSWTCGSFFAPNFNGFTLLSRQHSGESFMSLSRQTDGRHSNGRNSSPSPHKSFLRQMIPFQVDNRPTSQLSFSPLTVSVRCHSQRGEMWQTCQRDNILQPKGGALLGSVTHFHDSFLSPSCRKMSLLLIIRQLFLYYYLLFQAKTCQKHICVCETPFEGAVVAQLVEEAAN